MNDPKISSHLSKAEWNRWENGAPLHIAASLGKMKIIKILLESGVNVNAKTCDCWPSTALHFAVCSNQAEVVTLLLENGADPKIVGVLGGFKGDCVQLAIHKSFKNIEQLLLSFKN